MQWHDIFFFAALGFVLGAVSGGLDISPAGALIFSIILLTVFVVLRMRPYLVAVAVIAVFLLAGNVYYHIDDYRYYAAKKALDGITYFQGAVFDEPQRKSGSQTAKIEILASPDDSPSGARVLVYANPYPVLSYGDIVRVMGTITPPPINSYGEYLAKERIHAVSFYPAIEVVGNNANIFFEALYNIRRYTKDTISRLFSQQQSVLLSGILMGDREEFSKEFLNKLSVSGTLHLTALSGFNITIMVFFAIAVFSALFLGNRRAVFMATFFVVTLFVAMTGFTISALRAALMAFIVGLADQMGRMYNPRNAIACAAVVLTLINPKIPVFDLGFQLSFLATIAIIYFAPALRQLAFFKKEGFFHWRDVFALTIAAQLGVAPVAIHNFENFSFSALPANIAIVTIIPLLTILGFATVAASFVFSPLALLLSKPTAFLLDYTAGAVEVFYALRAPFNPDIGIVVAMAYYALLIYICARYSPAAKNFFI
ncbi:MAG TPA: ComEC/Rec2 family competence protein [Candidatus Paceibacterota bacterium]